MERRLGEENVPDQLLGNLAVDDGAGFDEVIQPGLPGKDDEGSYLLPAHAVAGSHGLGNDHIHFGHRLDTPQQAPELDAAQMVQHPPQLRLKEHHQGNEADGQELIQNKGHGVQVQQLGQAQDDHDHDHGLCHTHGIRRPDQGQQSVYEEGDQQNVQIICPLHSGHRLQQVLQCFHGLPLFYVNCFRSHIRLWYTYLLSCLL